MEDPNSNYEQRSPLTTAIDVDNENEIIATTEPYTDGRKADSNLSMLKGQYETKEEV